MRNDILYVRWQRNLVLFLLVVSLILNFIGWYRYREEKISRDGLEVWITNHFKTYDWGE